MEPFKNLLNEEVANEIANLLFKKNKKFKKDLFLKDIKKKLKPLELKDRVRFLSERLKESLPEDQVESLLLLKKIIKVNNEDKIGLDGFKLWPISEYVAKYGLNNFDVSMDVLKELTKAFTAEFAIRSFFIHDEKKTLKYFKLWVHDENEHVRRLVSEGSRPYLPWGQKLTNFAIDPNITWELLEQLKDDPSMYVRKSVANHLNDHSKNHPDWVVDNLLLWKKKYGDDEKVNWIIKHASRTLVKNGHKRAFKLHGVDSGKVKVLQSKIQSKNIKLGKNLEVEIEIQNLEKKKLKIILDHELHLLRKNGKYNIKCFKGKNLYLLPLEKMKIKFNIPLKVVTTRSYYTGVQYWNIKVNGVSEEKLAFNLKV